ncbi:hypothetical protein [Burkholderia ubonensis]|uniref:hypothetical protein n=1 Tax=Burkholderia ubonensis TaxID=101571 RepID=UPI0012FC8B9C|nr:hypothetical protein [Burkholderia ubonensis]
MSWDLDRFNCAEYSAANGRAADVPAAIIGLGSAKSEDEADDFYWKIDNVVILQGSLYSSGLPTIPCVIDAIQGATDVSRTRLLEILAQIGLASVKEDGHPDEDFRLACLCEISRGVSLYFHFIESENMDEVLNCIDLISICAIHDGSLKSRAIRFLNKVSAARSGEGGGELIENWTNDIG